MPFIPRPTIVKYSPIILLVSLLLAGCAATQTVDSRKQERYAAYQALAPELKAAVDQGQVKSGMSMDAVYIAWGKPSQVVSGGNAAGETTTWIYQGGYVQETRFWGYSRLHYAYDAAHLHSGAGNIRERCGQGVADLSRAGELG